MRFWGGLLRAQEEKGCDVRWSGVVPSTSMRGAYDFSAAALTSSRPVPPSSSSSPTASWSPIHAAHNSSGVPCTPTQSASSASPRQCSRSLSRSTAVPACEETACPTGSPVRSRLRIAIKQRCSNRSPCAPRCCTLAARRTSMTIPARTLQQSTPLSLSHGTRPRPNSWSRSQHA